MDHYETGLTGRLWEERRVADEACCSERLPHLSWPDRIEHYHHTTGNPQSLFMGGDGRVAGIFIMGNDYRVKSNTTAAILPHTSSGSRRYSPTSVASFICSPAKSDLDLILTRGHQ